jgi:hypothetical protein
LGNFLREFCSIPSTFVSFILLVHRSWAKKARRRFDHGAPTHDVLHSTAVAAAYVLSPVVSLFTRYFTFSGGFLARIGKAFCFCLLIFCLSLRGRSLDFCFYENHHLLCCWMLGLFVFLVCLVPRSLFGVSSSLHIKSGRVSSRRRCGFEYAPFLHECKHQYVSLWRRKTRGDRSAAGRSIYQQVELREKR